MCATSATRTVPAPAPTAAAATTRASGVVGEASGEEEGVAAVGSSARRALRCQCSWLGCLRAGAAAAVDRRELPTAHCAFTSCPSTALSPLRRVRWPAHPNTHAPGGSSHLPSVAHQKCRPPHESTTARHSSDARSQCRSSTCPGGGRGPGACEEQTHQGDCSVAPRPLSPSTLLQPRRHPPGPQHTLPSHVRGASNPITAPPRDAPQMCRSRKHLSTGRRSPRPSDLSSAPLRLTAKRSSRLLGGRGAEASADADQSRAAGSHSHPQCTTCSAPRAGAGGCETAAAAAGGAEAEAGSGGFGGGGGSGSRTNMSSGSPRTAQVCVEGGGPTARMPKDEAWRRQKASEEQGVVAAACCRG